MARKVKKPRTGAPAPAPALACTQGVWDWKDGPSASELREMLAPFGVVVTEHPACEGTDSYGFIFSNRELTGEELDEVEQSE